MCKTKATTTTLSESPEKTPSSKQRLLDIQRYTKPFVPTTFDNIKYFIGVAILIPFGPFVAWQIACSTLWEFVDKHTIRAIQGVEYFSGKVGPYFSGLTRHPKDGFVCLLLIYLAVLMPMSFAYELHLCCTVGFSIPRCLLFNIVRIGPMYSNFMWVYVSNPDTNSISYIIYSLLLLTRKLLFPILPSN